MSRRARSYVIGTTLVVIATLTAAPRPGLATTPVDDVLAKVGQWVAPFEEGGAETPRCRTDEEPGWAHGSLICKPAAADMIALPDGRVLYWDGLEGSENVDHTVGTELAPADMDPAQILQEAEAAMLRAKMDGGNRVERVALLPQSVTLVGAAALIGTTAREVVRLVRSGALRAKRQGRHFHIDRAEVENYRARTR